MLSPKSDIFLKEILSYVKFTFDHSDIRNELENHISDKVEYYVEQGYKEEEAEQLSIIDMGNAKEIGVELNQQHNPIIGWIWRITNAIAAFTTVGFGLLLLIYISTFFHDNLSDGISKFDIIYQIDLNEKVKIDDRVIRFTRIIYHKNGNMDIFYESYYASIWGTGWSLGYIGEITDDLGHKYGNGSGQQIGGSINKGVWTINHFSKAADALIITYDCYNRNYKVEIPLGEGDAHE